MKLAIGMRSGVHVRLAGSTPIKAKRLGNGEEIVVGREDIILITIKKD